MKRTVPCILVAIAVAGMLAGCGTNKAPEPASIALPLPADNPASTASAATPADAAQPAHPAVASTPIPAATSAIWMAIDKQSAALQEIVQNGTLKDVQGRANAIRDLTQALPAHASALSADAQAKLQQDVTLVAAFVEKLSAAGNAGDQAAAKSTFVKLNNVLGGMTRFP